MSLKSQKIKWSLKVSKKRFDDQRRSTLSHVHILRRLCTAMVHFIPVYNGNIEWGPL